MLDIINEIDILKLKEKLPERTEERILNKIEYNLLFYSFDKEGNSSITNLTEDLTEEPFNTGLFTSKLEEVDFDFFESYINYVTAILFENMERRTKPFLKKDLFYVSNSYLNANNTLSGTSGFVTYNLLYGYTKKENNKKELISKIKNAINIFNNLKNNENKVILEKNKKQIVLDFEDFELFSNTVKNIDINDLIKKTKEIKGINKDLPTIFIFKIPGFKSSLNIEKERDFIQKFIEKTNEKPFQKAICVSCFRYKEDCISAENFTEVVQSKQTQSFNLINNNKTEDRSFFICKSCLNKLKELSLFFSKYNFLYISRNGNNIKPINSISDLLYSNDTEEDIILGGTIFKIIKAKSEDNLIGKNKTEFAKFIYQLDFEQKNTTEERKRRFCLVNNLFGLKMEEGKNNKNYVNIYFESYGSENQISLIRKEIIKKYFNEINDFVLGKKDFLSRKLIIDTINIYYKYDNLYKSPLGFLFSYRSTDFNLDHFKSKKGEKMSKYIESIKEKSKNNKLNTLTPEENIIVAGAIISYLEKKNRGKDNDYGFIRSINISQKGIKKAIINAFDKYSHAIFSNQEKATNLISEVLLNFENQFKMDQNKLKELFYIGLLNNTLDDKKEYSIFTKSTKGEENE